MLRYPPLVTPPFRNPLVWVIVLIVVSVCTYLLTTRFYLITLAIGPIISIVLYILFINPTAGIYALLALIPFDDFRQLGGEAMRFLTISKLIGALVLAAAAWRVLIRHPETPNLKSNLWIWVGLFAITVVISALFNNELQSGASYLRKLFTAAITMTLVYAFCTSSRRFQQVPIVLSVAVTANGILTIIGYHFEISWLAMGTQESYELTRGIGGARDPNVFSSMVISIMPFLAYWFVTTDRLDIRLTSAAALLLNIYTVVLTMSRGGTLIALLILSIIALVYGARLKKQHLALVLVFTAAMIGAGSAVIPQTYWERQFSLLLAIEGEADRSINRRVSYVYVAWDRFRESPVIGHGPFQYPDLYARSDYAALLTKTTDVSGIGFRRRAHNTYLETLVELGIIGLSAFLAILFAGWRNFSHSVKRFRQAGDNHLADLTRAYQIAFLSQLLYFLFLSQTFSDITWAVLGMSVVALRLSGSAYRREPNTLGN